jgi:hypothetical protein
VEAEHLASITIAFEAGGLRDVHLLLQLAIQKGRLDIEVV